MGSGSNVAACASSCMQTAHCAGFSLVTQGTSPIGLCLLKNGLWSVGSNSNRESGFMNRETGMGIIGIVKVG